IHQRLLQSATPTLSVGLEKPCRVRAEGGLNEHLGRHESATGPDLVRLMLALDFDEVHATAESFHLLAIPAVQVPHAGRAMDGLEVRDDPAFDLVAVISRDVPQRAGQVSLGAKVREELLQAVFDFVPLRGSQAAEVDVGETYLGHWTPFFPEPSEIAQVRNNSGAAIGL
ncbi:hypothetical protein J4E08_23820, partial [Sagittula sp. NFXS13]